MTLSSATFKCVDPCVGSGRKPNSHTTRELTKLCDTPESKRMVTRLVHPSFVRTQPVISPWYHDCFHSVRDFSDSRCARITYLSSHLCPEVVVSKGRVLFGVGGELSRPLLRRRGMTCVIPHPRCPFPDPGDRVWVSSDGTRR